MDDNTLSAYRIGMFGPLVRSDDTLMRACYELGLLICDLQ